MASVDCMNKWFKSFLSDKQLCVKLGCGKSSWLDIISRVPEESACGPLL